MCRRSDGCLSLHTLSDNRTLCGFDDKILGSLLYSYNVVHPSAAIPKSLAFPLLKSPVLATPSNVADRSGVFISVTFPLFNLVFVPPMVADRSGVKFRRLRGRFEKWGSRWPLGEVLVPARDILNVTPRRVRRDPELEAVDMKEGRTGADGVVSDDKGEG
ncbi:hypothetical protein L208DRAFT_1394137 [Tricholoma matsutake]|nr:hypothetical protein L208DRAFT_1394137 [Tricholoma matsutake 945]